MIIYIIILAVVQGLTEFLPVSSSGHLVLLNHLFGIQNDFLLFSIILHVATLLSVLVYFWNDVQKIIKQPFGKTGRLIILSCVPTVVIAFVIKGMFGQVLDGKFLPFCFMITAFIIVITENCIKKYGRKPIGTKIAFLMGLMQGVAVIPGISRSGATICAGASVGGERKEVTKFSFFMSIPIIFGSLLFEVHEYVVAGMSICFSWFEIMIGFIISFLVGIFAIKFLLKIVQRSFIPFAIYLIFISAVSLIVINK